MINSVTAPSAASGTTTTSDATPVGPGGKLGKNEFLKLLVTQLRYQDPMNPLQGEQMAANKVRGVRAALSALGRGEV